MDSWRDGASQAVQDEIDNVFGAVMPFAVQSLEKYGEMYPLAVHVDATGDFHPIDGDPGVGNHPTSEQVLDRLYEVAPVEAIDSEAVAFVADVSVELGDAIRVEIEHREGPTVTVIVPYTRDDVTGDVDVHMHELAAYPGLHRVWGPAGDLDDQP